MGIDATLIPAVRDIVCCLVRQDYRALEIDGRIGRLTVVELARAIEDYGRTLIEIPDAGWDLAESYELKGRSKVLAVDLDLWTEEEGQSDLTLSLSIEESDDGVVALKIDDLHVL